MNRVIAGLLLLLLPWSAHAEEVPGSAHADEACGVPPAAADGWQVAAPEAAGFDPRVLCGIGDPASGWPKANIHAVLAARHGKLVYEHYFPGEDDRLGHPMGVVNFDAKTLHDLRSITKSVTALVLGIEIGKGRIGGVDTPVLAQFPEYADLRSPEKDRITVRDLLTMSQGLAWNEDLPYSNPANSEIRMDTAVDPVRYALAQPVEAPPGTVYNYSGGSAMIIAAMVHKATGRQLDDLAREDLFQPLGITDYEWRHFLSGDPVAASGLRMLPRDLIKIGQLVLDHGMWNGQQVVPANWVKAATSPQINGQLLFFYGYQFWIGRSFVHGQEIDWPAGVGYGGQRLFIVPSKDLVVLVHAGMYDSPMQARVPITVLNQYVLAALRD